MNLPTVDAVNALRIAKFKQRVSETIARGEATALRCIVEQLEAESGLPLIDIAAALASMSQGSTPLLLAGKSERPPPDARAVAEPLPSPPAASSAAALSVGASPQGSARKPRSKPAGSQMETFRIEVGSAHGIKPGNIVGAIANEAGIEGVHIGRVDIREDHSFVDLPEGMPTQVFKDLQKVRVAGRELRINRVSEKLPKPPRATLGRHPAGRTPGRRADGMAAAGRPADRKMLSRRKVKN
jgi:ATP-dependent RNA helicase DeaD